MKAKKRHDESDSTHADELESVSSENPETIEDLRQLVERRAYELWLIRGCGDGDPMVDWLQAETEVYQTLNPQVSGTDSTGSASWQLASHGR